MDIKRVYTPDYIDKLKHNQIFCFGSNTQGRHGKGAALIAKNKFGAKQFQPYGLQGQSYAIITKELRSWKPKITLEQIKHQINILFEFAYKNKNLEFLVVKIGCTLAGFSIEQIKNLFLQVIDNKGFPSNIILPKEFIF